MTSIAESHISYRRPPPPPLRNTDRDVDCTPYEHVQYRPFCQTIRLEKRRKAFYKKRAPRLPAIMENLCMFEWLHRTGVYKQMSNEDLLFILTNGLFHQDKGNVAIVINKDHRTGKSATSRMNAAFGKAENRKDALKEFMAAHKSPKVGITIPENLKKYGIGNVIPPMKTKTSSGVSSEGPSTSSASEGHQKDIEVITLN